MKNIFKIGTLALCLVVGLSSCNDFFDAIPGEQYDLEDTFTNRSKTEQFLNNVNNITRQLSVADGAVCATTFKYDGVFENAVDVKRVKEFMDKVKEYRATL